MYRNTLKRALLFNPGVRRLSAAAQKYEQDTIELMDKVFAAAGEIFSEQLTILDLIERFADKDPNAEQLIFQGESFSRGWIRDKINQTANGLGDIGLNEGDYCAVMAPNSPEFITTVYGCTSGGVTPALINTSMSGHALKHCIEVAGAKALIIDSTMESVIEKLKLDIPIVSNGKNYGLGLVDDLIKGKSASRPEYRPTPMDEMALIYTSGTTGLPKAAIKKHMQPCLTGYIADWTYSYVENESLMLLSLPLFHFSGLLHTCIPFGTGGKLLLEPKFSVRKSIQLMKEYPVSHFIYIGELIRYINQVPEQPDDKDIQLKQICGNGLNTTEWVKFVNRFGSNVEVAEVYGASELPTVLKDNARGCTTPGALTKLTPNLQEVNGVKLVKYDEETLKPLRNSDGFLMECGVGEPGICVMRVTEVFAFSGYHG